MLNRRLQILLDQERYERLAQRAESERRSIAMLVRDAIDARYPPIDPEREAAFERIRTAEPMDLPADPTELKRELLQTRRTWQ